MIFYTLKGPKHTLEIHDDKIKLVKKAWLKILTPKDKEMTWNLAELSQFQITIPKYLFWGKIEWQTFDGKKGAFRFSTNALMVQKIEKYLQKLIIKNFQHENKVIQLKKKRFIQSLSQTAA